MYYHKLQCLKSVNVLVQAIKGYNVVTKLPPNVIFNEDSTGTRAIGLVHIKLL
jgi:hypothetical protein